MTKQDLINQAAKLSFIILELEKKNNYTLYPNLKQSTDTAWQYRLTLDQLIHQHGVSVVELNDTIRWAMSN